MEELTGPTGAILIVEDDPAVRRDARDTVRGRRTPDDRPRRHERGARTGGVLLPDVIIADYNLPGELTGAEVIARLRESLQREIPAIILTGDISSDTLRKIAHADCVHLSKPAEPETLTQQIQGFLAAKQRPKSGETARQADLSATDGPRPAVFVVDDDRTVRDDIQELLHEHGYLAEAYASGEAFLAVDLPDRKGCLVTVTDALMPGMGGIALLERLKAENRGLPAIMITGHGDPGDEGRSRRLSGETRSPRRASGEHRTRARAHPGFGKASRVAQDSSRAARPPNVAGARRLGPRRSRTSEQDHRSRPRHQPAHR
jgi:two-component system, chemotaxis family, CheB/CheR fusion protein